METQPTRSWFRAYSSPGGAFAFGEKGGGLVELTGVQSGLYLVVAEDGDTRHDGESGQRHNDVADDAQGSAASLRLFEGGVEFGVAGFCIEVRDSGSGRSGTEGGLLFMDDRGVGGRCIAQGLFEGNTGFVGLPGLGDFFRFFGGFLRLFGGELLSLSGLFGSGLLRGFRFLRGALGLFGGSFFRGFGFFGGEFLGTGTSTASSKTGSSGSAGAKNSSYSERA